MTWRERIQAARKRGYFTENDCRTAMDPQLCAIGEVSHGHYMRFSSHPIYLRWQDTQRFSRRCIGGRFPEAIERNNFDLAEQLLDKAEDLALQMKREELAAALGADKP